MINFESFFIDKKEEKRRLEAISLHIESLKLYNEYKKPLKRPISSNGFEKTWDANIIKRSAIFYENMFYPNRIYIKMNEFFCPLMSFPDREDMMLPYSALVKKYPERLKHGGREKFAYADGWCRILYKNTSWLRIDNLQQAYFVESGLAIDYIPIALKLYTELVRLSNSREEFYHLEPYEKNMSDMSAAYWRLCQDISTHYYIALKHRKHETN